MRTQNIHCARAVRRFGAVGLAAAMAACSSVQTTQPGAIGITRTQQMSPLVSASELERGAVQAYAQIVATERKEGDLNADPAMTARVRGVAARLIPQVPVFRPDAAKWNWEVNVIKSDELNAWCMPGGKIAFYSAIISRLKLTDAEIAAIMGHEIAHALREHARERASEQATSGLLIGVGAAVLGAGQAGADLTQMAYQSVFGLKHSRLHETEADRIGVELAARAGYDPRAAISLWEKMNAAAGGKSGPEFLSTHPSPESRIADLRVYAAKTLPLYQAAAK
ncbi:MAG: M48 family metallopeptidase [Lautropia sp.]